MHIASCGHEEENSEDMTQLYSIEYDCGVLSIMSGVYCNKCTKALIVLDGFTESYEKAQDMYNIARIKDEMVKNKTMEMIKELIKKVEV